METVDIICTIIGTAGTVLVGIWWIIKREKKSAVNDYRLDKLEDNLDQVIKDTSEVKSDLVFVKSDLSFVKTDITSIKSILSQNNPKLAASMTNKKSPRRLNDLGQNIFEQIEGEKLLNDNKDFFYSNIDRMNPKTAYDVEIAANYACIGYTDNDIFNDIKMYVYNAPSIMVKDENNNEVSHDLTLSDVCFTLSIPLRDMYLKDHPEILQ